MTNLISSEMSDIEILRKLIDGDELWMKECKDEQYAKGYLYAMSDIKDYLICMKANRDGFISQMNSFGD